MEILAIHAGTDLRTRPGSERPSGTFVYHINCRQFNSAHRSWQLHRTTQPEMMVLMTLNFERIWMTNNECTQVANAIKELQPNVTLTSETFPA